jgi:hypothetical protein
VFVTVGMVLGSNTWAAVVSDEYFDYTAAHHVDSREVLEVPTGGISAEHFSLYSDSGLDHEVRTDTTVRRRSMTIVPAGTTTDATCVEDRGDWSCDDSIQQIAGDGERWGLGSEYWLVRSHDKNNEQLAKPVVTKIVVDRVDGLTSPVFLVNHDEGGTAEITWRPIEGADEYRIVLSENGPDGVRHTVAAATDRTSWTAEQAQTEHEVLQNVALRFRESFTEDDSPGAEPDKDIDYQICVIATNGSVYSGCNAKDAVDSLGSLPYTHAMNTQQEKWDAAEAEGGVTFDNVPTRVYYTSLDGSLRSTPGTVDPEDIAPDGSFMTVMGVGTQVGYRITGTGFDAESAEKFNRKAALDGGNNGNADTDSEVSDEDLDEGETQDVETPYPVYGSTELVRFLARHMMNHTEVVDASAFLSQPGAPDLEDALNEAIYQNPYSLWIDQTYFDNGTIRFVYSYSAEEQAALQAEIAAKVDDVVGDVITSGMSDAQKVTALNNWLRNHATYDMDALDFMVRTNSVEGYEYTQTPEGVLLRGTGVCASYADAFLLLANEAGVETVEVTGVILDGNGPHAWNKSKVDGHWVAVDVTWNDTDGRGQDDEYLMIDDSEFTGAAAREEDRDWMVDNYLSEYATS